MEFLTQINDPVLWRWLQPVYMVMTALGAGMVSF